MILSYLWVSFGYNSIYPAHETMGFNSGGIVDVDGI